MSQLVEDLKACKAELKRRGWTKGNLVRPDGTVCMLGAIGCALIEGFGDLRSGRYYRLEEDPRTNEVVRALATHLPKGRDAHDEIDQIFIANDSKDTTLEDVYNFFDKALAEQGGL